jgi:hypothetical protein
VPGIHDFGRAAVKDVDGRDKLGHDEIVSSSGWKDLTALIAFSVRFSG